MATRIIRAHPNRTGQQFSFIMRSIALFFVASTVFLALSTAQEEAKDLKLFRRAFVGTARETPSIRERSQALALLVGHDSKAIARVLAEAFDQVAQERAAVSEVRRKANVELEKLLAGKEFDPKRVLPQQAYNRYNELRNLSVELRAKLDALRVLEDDVLASLGELEAPDSLNWLLAKVVGDKKKPFSLKLAIVRRAAVIGEPVLEGMIKALSRARRAEEMTVLLDGVGRLGPDASQATKNVLKLLRRKESTVRERAAWALSMIAAPEGIAPLLERLAKERGLTRKRMAIALEVLTRQPLGLSLEAWNRWWEKEGARHAAGEVPLGGGKPSLTAPKGGSGYYYGIPQEGESILYVIDCSGSMVVSMDDPQFQNRQPVPARDPAKSRIEACKRELARAVSELAPGTRFNIVAYNDVPFRYKAKLLVADEASLKAAQAWIRDLGASQTTNIHDAMQTAFEFAGRGSHDRYYGAQVDTIFLLTDGSPTKADGSLDSTEKVLDAVRRWNPLKRVVVHCVGVGKGLNEPFLKSLAAQNGGRYVSK